MFCGIFSITAISCSPVIRWTYQQVLAVEVKNFAKITFLSFNTTSVFCMTEWCRKMTFL